MEPRLCRAASVTMPTFFFHSTGALPYQDEDGVELPDTRSAETEGLRVLGELLKDASGWFAGPDPLALEVTDADGRTILTLEVRARRPGLTPP